jgi:hypothetical protein
MATSRKPWRLLLSLFFASVLKKRIGWREKELEENKLGFWFTLTIYTRPG